MILKSSLFIHLPPSPAASRRHHHFLLFLIFQRLLSLRVFSRPPFHRSFPASITSLSCVYRSQRTCDTAAQTVTQGHQRQLPWLLLLLLWPWRQSKIHLTSSCCSLVCLRMPPGFALSSWSAVMCTIDVRIVLYKSDIKIRELPVFCIMVVYFYCDSSEVYSVLGALPGG